MKKIYLIILVVGVLFLLTGCKPQKLDLTKQSTVTYKELSFNLIEGYEKEETITSTTYNMESRTEKCTFDISTSKDNHTIGQTLESEAKKTLVKYQSDRNDNKVISGTETINGVEWLLLIYADAQDGQLYSEHVMVALYNGEYYKLHYTDLGNTKSCNNIVKYTKDSFKFN